MKWQTCFFLKKPFQVLSFSSLWMVTLQMLHWFVSKCERNISNGGSNNASHLFNTVMNVNYNYWFSFNKIQLPRYAKNSAGMLK